MSAPQYTVAAAARRSRIAALRAEEEALALRYDVPLADGAGVVCLDTALAMADEEEVEAAIERLEEVRRELAEEEYLASHPELPLWPQQDAAGGAS